MTALRSVVLTNLDSTRASANLANKIAGVLFSPSGDQIPVAEAKAIFSDLQKGKIDRSRLTSNANAYFSDEALRDFAASLAPLGQPEEFAESSEAQRGGMTFRRYEANCSKKSVAVLTYTMPDGKLEQYLVSAKE